MVGRLSAILVVLLLVGTAGSAALSQVFERVSISSAGAEASDHCSAADISADGRYVTFRTKASSLVAGDANGYEDVFVRDRTAGTTVRVSVGPGGQEGNGPSGTVYGLGEPSLAIAQSGLVAFGSFASNFVAGDITEFAEMDIFVNASPGGGPELASQSTSGENGNFSASWPAMSSDGKVVAFLSGATNLIPSDGNGQWDVFVRDRAAHKTELASVTADGMQVNGDSYWPAISGDGRYVAFGTSAPNTVPGDTNASTDVFLRDRVGKTTERISFGLSGAQPDNECRVDSVSADGRYVTYGSGASNLIPGDTNDSYDVFVYDRTKGTTECVSVSSEGTLGDDDSKESDISGDGRYVVYQSHANNLLVGKTEYQQQIYVHDRVTHQTAKVSVAASGEWTSGGSGLPAISQDGKLIALQSDADGFVTGDSNEKTDVFVAHNPFINGASGPPVLSWAGTSGYTDDGVRPNRGQPDQTNFAFRVKITDQGGGPLTKRKAIIGQLGADGAWATHKSMKLTRKSGSLQTGAIYRAITTLPNGVYRYRFSVANADGAGSGAPTSWQEGPKPLGPPMLCWSQKKGYKTDGVNPNSGPVETTFIFKVLYMDGAGDAPRRKKLLIRRNGGLWRSFEMRGVAGGDRRTGKTYRKDVTIGKTGRYAYRFEFYDASGAATGEPTEWRSIGDIASGGTLQLTGLSAVPTAAGAQVTFGLSVDASVSARVLNLAGRPVRTLFVGRECEAGANTLVWNAASDAGVAVPNGTYLIEVTARAEGGGEARALGRVTVRR